MAKVFRSDRPIVARMWIEHARGRAASQPHHSQCPLGLAGPELSESELLQCQCPYQLVVSVQWPTHEDQQRHLEALADLEIWLRSE